MWNLIDMICTEERTRPPIVQCILHTHVQSMHVRPWSHSMEAGKNPRPTGWLLGASLSPLYVGIFRPEGWTARLSLCVGDWERKRTQIQRGISVLRSDRWMTPCADDRDHTFLFFLYLHRFCMLGAGGLDQSTRGTDLPRAIIPPWLPCVCSKVKAPSFADSQPGRTLFVHGRPLGVAREKGRSSVYCQCRTCTMLLIISHNMRIVDNYY